jgi:hypothetical protein
VHGAPVIFWPRPSAAPCVVRKALMVTVEVDSERVESRLAAGEVACPSCPQGVLVRWGFARSRPVVGMAEPVRPRRSRCRGCAGDPCVVAGDVVAAQGLSGRADLGGGGGQGGRCRASGDRGAIGDSRIDGPRLAAGDHRASRGAAVLVRLDRGHRGGRRVDTEGDRITVRGCDRRGRPCRRVVGGAVRRWAGDRCGDGGAGRCRGQRCPVAVTGLAVGALTGSVQHELTLTLTARIGQGRRR